jgi:hypothetical protein
MASWTLVAGLRRTGCPCPHTGVSTVEREESNIGEGSQEKVEVFANG